MTSDGPFPHFACSSSSFDQISFLTTYMSFFLPINSYVGLGRRRQRSMTSCTLVREPLGGVATCIFLFACLLAYEVSPPCKSGGFGIAKKKKHFPLECPFKPSYRIQYPLSVSIIPCPLQLNLSGLCMKAMLVCLVHAKVVDNRHLNMHSATHPVQVPAMRLKKCCRIE